MKSSAARSVDLFPASLPSVAMALKLCRVADVPSDFAAFSATFQLSAIVRDHRPASDLLSRAQAADLRHLARQLDAAVVIRGRTA